MFELTDRNLNYEVPAQTVEETLRFLRRKGLEDGDEGVVLWPGRLTSAGCSIVTPYIPEQITGPYMYEIPQRAVIEILKWCHQNKLVIPIQVHSHLFEAFHSCADDELAFVQHENGISIVVPDAGDIAPADFAERAEFFRLVNGTNWEQLSKAEVRQRFKWIAP